MAGIYRSLKTRLSRVAWNTVALALALTLSLALAACSGTPEQQSTPEALPTTSAPVETIPAQAVGQTTTTSPEPSATQGTVTAGVAPADSEGLNSQQGVELPALNCTGPADPTPAMTEGPYYTPNTPERASLLEPGMPGTRLVISGYVLTVDCQPIPGAWLDFWQADANGEYDNAGFRLRGHQFSDAQGRYQLETVLPGEYPGRTQHIHVKVQAPGGEVLTSQLFFPDAAGNASDSIFSPRLVVEMQDTADGIHARFNFILDH